MCRFAVGPPDRTHASTCPLLSPPCSPCLASSALASSFPLSAESARARPLLARCVWCVLDSLCPLSGVRVLCRARLRVRSSSVLSLCVRVSLLRLLFLLLALSSPSLAFLYLALSLLLLLWPCLYVCEPPSLWLILLLSLLSLSDSNLSHLFSQSRLSSLSDLLLSAPVPSSSVSFSLLALPLLFSHSLSARLSVSLWGCLGFATGAGRWISHRVLRSLSPSFNALTTASFSFLLSFPLNAIGKLPRLL